MFIASFRARNLPHVILVATGTGRIEDKKETFEKNVLIEAFCVHARNLVEFLYNSGSPHANSLLAVHYFDAGVWTKRRNDEMDELYTRVSCEIDHLTTDRFTDQRARPILIFLASYGNRVGGIACSLTALAPTLTL